MDEPPYYTTGALAKRFGVETWKIRRLFERGILTTAPRVGAYRVIAAGDLWRVERALRSVGYLKETEAPACAS